MGKLGVRKEAKLTYLDYNMEPINVDHGGWRGVVINTRRLGDELTGVVTQDPKVAFALADAWERIGKELKAKEEALGIR